MKALPWYIDIVNYLVTVQLPEHWTKQEGQISYVNKEFLLRWSLSVKVWCKSNYQIMHPKKWILKHPFILHEQACGGYFSATKTTAKVLQRGFYWTTLFQEKHSFCSSCDMYQCMGSITWRNMMPLNPVLMVAIFYV